LTLMLLHALKYVGAGHSQVPPGRRTETVGEIVFLKKER